MSLNELYLTDETAWLEQMSNLIKERSYADLDYDHLSEFLEDMAKRDKREVLHRLSSLLAHLLKWEQQPSMRSSSWMNTIRNQREHLQDMLDSQTLKNHANAVLSKAYDRARRQAVAETGLKDSLFPAECPYTLDQLLTEE